MTYQPIPHLIAVEKAKSALRKDPLASFKFRNPRQRDLVRFVRQGLEVACRAPNRSGKTTIGAYLGVAIARGLTHLDGEPLPYSPCPNVGVVLARSYGQMVESVQAAYLDAVGLHPHERAYTDKQRGYIKVIRVRPDNWPHDEPETWSKIYFVSQENEDSITGFGADWIHGDEPPVEQVWREARVRIRAGRQLHRWITFTPLHRSEWEWIRADFEGRGALEQPKDGRIEMVMTLDGNRALTQAERDHLDRATIGDVFRDARLRGEYVDAEGENPFAPWFDVLERWDRNAKDPQVKPFLLRDEAGNQRSAVVQVFDDPDPAETYLMVLDPSRGLGAPYDPAGIHVWGRRNRRLVARYGSMKGILGSGYLPAYSLGILAAQLGDWYHQALADVEMQGGYGDSVMVALRQSGYFNFNRDVAPDRPARIDETYGFATSVATRPQWVAAIQEGLDRSQGQTDFIHMPSRDVAQCLKAIVFNDKGKPLAAHGRHDEDMILMGRALHVLMDPRRKPAPFFPANGGGMGGGIEDAVLRDLYGVKGAKRAGRAPDAEPEAW